MARSKAERSAVRGKRVPLLIMIVHPKPMGKPQPRAARGKTKTTARSKR
jgi:hypothetical protein